MNLQPLPGGVTDEGASQGDRHPGQVTLGLELHAGLEAQGRASLHARGEDQKGMPDGQSEGLGLCFGLGVALPKNASAVRGLWGGPYHRFVVQSVPSTLAIYI